MYKPLCYKSRGFIFFPIDKIPRKRIVMKTLGVRKKTFAGDMISRMYDYYFDGAVDFKKEYKRFYSKEFDSLEDFIEEHYNIEREKAKIYASGHYAMKNCDRRSLDRNVETLNYDEDFKMLFAEAIGGIEDEDPDGFYYE